MGFKSFEPLKVLQELQHVTMFSQLVSPPFDFGTTWSSVNGFFQKYQSNTDICTYLSNKHLIVKILRSSEIYEIFAALLCLAHPQLPMAI